MSVRSVTRFSSALSMSPPPHTHTHTRTRTRPPPQTELAAVTARASRLLEEASARASSELAAARASAEAGAAEERAKWESALNAARAALVTARTQHALHLVEVEAAHAEECSKLRSPSRRHCSRARRASRARSWSTRARSWTRCAPHARIGSGSSVLTVTCAPPPPPHRRTAGGAPGAGDPARARALRRGQGGPRGAHLRAAGAPKDDGGRGQALHPLSHLPSPAPSSNGRRPTRRSGPAPARPSAATSTTPRGAAVTRRGRENRLRTENHAAAPLPPSLVQPRGRGDARAARPAGAARGGGGRPRGQARVPGAPDGRAGALDDGGGKLFLERQMAVQVRSTMGGVRGAEGAAPPRPPCAATAGRDHRHAEARVTEHVNGVQVRAIDVGGRGTTTTLSTRRACRRWSCARPRRRRAPADAEAALGHEELARMQQQQQAAAASSSAAAAAAEAPGGVELADMHVRGTRSREGEILALPSASACPPRPLQDQLGTLQSLVDQLHARASARKSRASSTPTPSAAAAAYLRAGEPLAAPVELSADDQPPSPPGVSRASSSSSSRDESSDVNSIVAAAEAAAAAALSGGVVPSAPAPAGSAGEPVAAETPAGGRQIH